MLCFTNCRDVSNFIVLCRPGALPYAQNNPQKTKYSLYTEGVSGMEWTVRISALAYDIIGRYLDDRFPIHGAQR